MPHLRPCQPTTGARLCVRAVLGLLLALAVASCERAESSRPPTSISFPSNLGEAVPEFLAPADTPDLVDYRYADVPFFLLRDATGRVRAFLHSCGEPGCEGTRYTFDERRCRLLCTKCCMEITLDALEDPTSRCRPIEIPCAVADGRVRVDPRRLRGETAQSDRTPGLTVRPAIEVGTPALGHNCGSSPLPQPRESE